MKRLTVALLLALASPFAAFGQGIIAPVDITADTGAHTCTSIGQEHKVYQSAYAGDDRYFVNMKLSAVSIYGTGFCDYSPDHAPTQTKVFCNTDADGQPECEARPVRVTIRAFADCTNNVDRIGSRVAAECRFTATSKRGKPQ